MGVIAFRKRRATDTRMVVDTGVLVHDIRYFLIAYGLAIATAFLPPSLDVIRYAVAFLLIGIYAWYVKGHFAEEAEEEQDDLAPLRFHRMDRVAHREDPAAPRLRIVNLQVIVALVCIVGGAWLFVGAVEELATTLGISELLLALVIAPIATELPEKFNSLIWVRQGKDTLAMGNITGAMVFQSAFPTFIALVFAGCRLARQLGLAAGVPVGRDHVRRRRGDLRPDVAPRHPRRQGAADRRGAVPAVSRARRPRDHRRPADRLTPPDRPGGAPGAAC